MVKTFFFYISVILLFFAACTSKNKVPEDVMPPAKMQEVLWDILKTNALAEEMIKQDTAKNLNEEMTRLHKNVFVIHGVSKATFEKSYNYYLQQPDLFNTILDSIIANGERKRIKPAIPDTLQMKSPFGKKDSIK